MELPKWKLSEVERQANELAWMHVKGACEKSKEKPNAQNEHISKMFKEMTDSYYS
tara:strand:+ start:270 stop:434 length:165 start_codon:yes stop_codon:yes gene_type:complete